MRPYYQDSSVTIYLGDCLAVMPTLERVDHVITDPPYSEYVHAKVRRATPLPDDHGIYGRAREIGFVSLTDEFRRGSADHFARLASRWSLVFSDIESCHLWRADLQATGLDYVRTGLWHKLGSTPQFTGDRPATAFETITIVHPPGRKRWNGGGRHGWWDFGQLDAELVWGVPIAINRSGMDPRLHTTQKPLSLMKAIIEDFTSGGDDPGSVRWKRHHWPRGQGPRTPVHPHREGRAVRGNRSASHGAGGL